MLPVKDSRKLAWVRGALVEALIDGIITKREQRSVNRAMERINSIEEFSDEQREIIDRVVDMITEGKRTYETLLEEID